MQNYKNTHWWMILVFIVLFLGFARGYWTQFLNESFGHHLHMFSVLCWFALIMSQPYLATRGNLKAHRRNGMIGLVIAGMVVASSAVMMPANIEGALSSQEDGFVGATFLYGVTFVDLITIVGFAACVIMAMLKSRDVDEHASWMIASVFMIFAPAFGRFMIFPFSLIFGFENLTFIKIMLYSTPLVLGFIGIAAWRLGRFSPALRAAFVVNLTPLFIGPVGTNGAWRTFCEAVFR